MARQQVDLIAWTVERSKKDDALSQGATGLCRLRLNQPDKGNSHHLQRIFSPIHPGQDCQPSLANTLVGIVE
jgi:hypothetical protein